MTEIEAKILGILEGRPTNSPSLTRDVMSNMTGIHPRQIRLAMASLQAQGHPIISPGKGYRLATTQEEIESFLRRESHRAFTILKKLRQLRHLVPQHFFRELADQLTLF